MNEVRNLLFGLEITREGSQLSYFDRKLKEPAAIPAKLGTNRAIFPTLLAKTEGKEEWSVGLQAEKNAGRSGQILFEDFYDLVHKADEVLVDGRSLDPSELLAAFIRSALELTGVADAPANISHITVTTDSLTPVFIANLKAAMTLLGLSSGRYTLQDHMTSFYYYVFSQKSEFRARKMALFHFRGDQVTFSALDTDRVSRPVLVLPEKQEGIRLPSLGGERDSAFYSYAREHMEGRLFSSVFLTGEGFDKSWAEKWSIPYLCKGGRHVFAGKNLYVRGACYASYDLAEAHTLKDVLFMGEDLVRTNVGMDLLVGGNPSYCSLVSAGQNWYEAGETLEIIPEEMDGLVFQVRSLDGKTRRKVKMELPGLPERPKRMTRLRVEAFLSSPTHCHIRVTDLGFGQFAPASGYTCEDELIF